MARGKKKLTWGICGKKVVYRSTRLILPSGEETSYIKRTEFPEPCSGAILIPGSSYMCAVCGWVSGLSEDEYNALPLSWRSAQVAIAQDKKKKRKKK